MRVATVFMAILALVASSTAFAGNNPQVTIPLHAKASSFEACTGLAPVDCTANRPTVNVSPGPVAIFVTLMNYTGVAGLQTAFDNSSNWTFTFGLWDCQIGQLNAVTPGAPFGATAGSITTAFTCVSSGALIPIGRMFFIATAGCIAQIQSSYPFGIHVLDCEGGIDQITDSEQGRLGKICVSSGGVDACDPISAVESTTWGQIKASY
jgi:hypothetical protein